MPNTLKWALIIWVGFAIPIAAAFYLPYLPYVLGGVLVLGTIALGFALNGSQEFRAKYSPPQSEEEALMLVLEAVKWGGSVNVQVWRKFLAERGVSDSKCGAVISDVRHIWERHKGHGDMIPSANLTLRRELASYVETYSSRWGMNGFRHRTTRLQKAIERLYEVFSVYPKPQEIEACEHCNYNRDIEEILSYPLKHIPEKVVWEYNFSAFFTIGDVPDYKYFLPRILDLQSRFDVTSMDPETTFSKLCYADWLNWPEQEVVAIREYLEAAFEAMIESPVLEDDPAVEESWVNGIARAGIDIDPFLEVLDRPAAAAHKTEMLDQMYVLDGDTESWWYPDNDDVDDPEPFAAKLDENREKFIGWAKKNGGTPFEC